MSENQNEKEVPVEISKIEQTDDGIIFEGFVPSSAEPIFRKLVEEKRAEGFSVADEDPKTDK